MSIHYRKQSDGKSWLVFEKNGSRTRRLAMVRIAAEKPPYVPEIEYLDCKGEEKAKVSETADQIAKVYADSQLKVCLMCQTPLVRAYVERLVKACGAEEAVIIRDYEGRSSEEVFESCVKELYWSFITNKAEFKEVWLVAGRENYPLKVFSDQVRGWCKEMHLAFTHPSFEYWMMLHDGAFDGALPFDKERVVSAEEKEERIGRGKYRRTIVCEIERATSAAACRQAFRERYRGTMTPEVLVENLIGGLGLAISRAEQADPDEAEHLTQMPELVKRLCRLGKRTLEAVVKTLEDVSAKPKTEQEAPESAETPAPATEPASEPPPVKGIEEEGKKLNEETMSEAPSVPASTEEEQKEAPSADPALVMRRLYEYSGSWYKVAPSSLSQEERENIKAAVLAGLDYLGKTYKALEGKEPALTRAMLLDANVLRTGEMDKADACFVEHAKRLRGYLGHFVKRSMTIAGKVCLNTLCELTLCNIWFDRDAFNPESAEEAPTDVNPDSSEAHPEIQEQAVKAGNEAEKAPSEADPSLSEKVILASILPEKAKDDAKDDEGPDAEPAAAASESGCRLADDIAVAVHYLEQTLKPFVQKKNCTVKPYQLDEMIRSVSLVTEWLADVYELRFSHLPSLPAAAEAAVNRINAHDTVETRRDFVKAVTAFLGTIASLQKQGAFAEEGTLLTARTNAVIVETWLQNVAAEAG